jgi:transcription elongation factor Elf1
MEIQSARKGELMMIKKALKKDFNCELWSENLCPFCGSDQVKVELDPEDSNETWIANANCKACGEKWTNVWCDYEGKFIVHSFGVERIYG